MLHHDGGQLSLQVRHVDDVAHCLLRTATPNPATDCSNLGSQTGAVFHINSHRISWKKFHTMVVIHCHELAILLALS